MKDIESILRQAVDILGIMDAIPFDDADAIRAGVAQPTLFMEAAKLRVQSMRRRAQAEMALSSVRSKRAIGIRYAASQNGEKISNDAVKEKLDLSPSVKQAAEALARMEEQEEFCKLLLEGLRERRDMIEAVNYTNNAQYRELGKVDAATRMTELREQLKNKYPGRA